MGNMRETSMKRFGALRNVASGVLALTLLAGISFGVLAQDATPEAAAPGEGLFFTFANATASGQLFVDMQNGLQGAADDAGVELKIYNNNFDGETALRRVHQRTYDLALCDWKMPGLGGQEIYERLRYTSPALSERMIFITGDVINDRVQDFLKARNKVCLSKPFSLGEFRAVITQAFAQS